MQLRTIHAGEHSFVFLLKEPLYYVCVSRTGESDSQVRIKEKKKIASIFDKGN